MTEASLPVELILLTLILSLFGGLSPIFSKIKENRETMRRITAIASGILLASAILVVIPEGFELAAGGHDSHDEDGNNEVAALGSLIIGGAILAGFVMMLIMEGFGIGHAVHEEHHDHEEKHGHAHIHHQASQMLLVLGLSLHSAADGLAIGAAAASGMGTVTALVVFAVLVHKVPAAFSLGVFALHERENRNAAIRDVALFSLATPVMILIAFFAFEGLDGKWIGLAMLFAAGTFLYVATVDTLPDIHNPETGRSALIHVLIGVILLAATLFIASEIGVIGHAH